MKSDVFINCHVHAYEYFGGVTRLFIPDNLKTGITKNTRYETVIPKAYREMADHYDTAIVPAEKIGVATSEQSVKTIQFITRIMIKSIFTGDKNPNP